MTQQIKSCQCGNTPEVKKIGEWPAQYRVVCKCGLSARGYYYGSHEKGFRHFHAHKSAVQRWNKDEFESPEDALEAS